MSYCICCGHDTTERIPEGDTRPRSVCAACGHIHYKNPLIVAGTLCVHEGSVLLCRRAIEPRLGHWTLPAGFLELGESTSLGAVRETAEEAEAIVLTPKLYTLINIPHLGEVHMIYLAVLKDGQFGCGVESLECRLFGLDELPSELAFASVAKSIELFCADFIRFGERLTSYPFYELCLDPPG